MGIETKETTIGNTRYRATMVPSKEARAFAVRLFQIGAPAAAAAAKGGEVGVIKELASLLTEDDIERAVALFLGNKRMAFTVDGGKTWPDLDGEMADLHFAGKTDELMRLLMFCLEMNYSSFLGGIKAALAKHFAKQAAATPPTV